MLLAPARTWGVSRGVAARLLAPLILLLLELHAGRAAAASGSTGEKQARELFQRAEKSFNLGQFADALADYQAAYEAKPLPAFLFNIAQCYRNMQNYERARFFFRRYLALDPRTTNRHLVEDLIAEMTQRARHDDRHDRRPSAGRDPPRRRRSSHRPPAAASAPLLAPPAAARARARARAGRSRATRRPRRRPSPIYKRWWFWTGAGAVVAAGVAVAFLALRAETPQGSLGDQRHRPGLAASPIDGRAKRARQSCSAKRARQSFSAKRACQSFSAKRAARAG